MSTTGFHLQRRLENNTEYQKLFQRMNPPRVIVDNLSSDKATLVKVDTANKQGLLLLIVQILTDLELDIQKAYISSDGGWLMDVFHVTDANGNKVEDADKVQMIKKAILDELNINNDMGSIDEDNQQALLGQLARPVQLARLHVPSDRRHRKLQRSITIADIATATNYSSTQCNTDMLMSRRHARSASDVLSCATDAAMADTTCIELTGTDRPGLMSEIFAVLAYQHCNVVAAELWTHNTRAACLIWVTDLDSVKSEDIIREDEEAAQESEKTNGKPCRSPFGGPIRDEAKLKRIKDRLKRVLRSHNARATATTTTDFCSGVTHTDRRLHQLMFADRDYDDLWSLRRLSLPNGALASPSGRQTDDVKETKIHVYNCTERGYSVVSVECRNRAKLFFDTVCTLTDMEYVVFHATVTSEAETAFQEYYIRHVDGGMLNSEAERRRLKQCLKAAIERRVSKGLRLELCTQDRVGLLSDVTRIFREHGLSVAGADVATKGHVAHNVFDVTDASGNPHVDPRLIDAVRREIGETVLRVLQPTGPATADNATTSPTSYVTMLPYYTRSAPQSPLCGSEGAGGNGSFTTSSPRSPFSYLRRVLSRSSLSPTSADSSPGAGRSLSSSASSLLSRSAHILLDSFFGGFHAGTSASVSVPSAQATCPTKY